MNGITNCEITDKCIVKVNFKIRINLYTTLRWP